MKSPLTLIRDVRSWWISRRFQRALRNFQIEPAKCFENYGGEPYDWIPTHIDGELFFLDNIWVRILERQVGYVQRITMNKRERSVTIGHFAIEHGFTRLGLGRILATAFSEELRRREGIRTIIFDEDHSKFEQRGYEAFFRALGAEPLARKHCWRWDFASEAARKDTVAVAASNRNSKNSADTPKTAC